MFQAGQASSGVLTGERAGFWRRFAAALIDGLIVGLATGIPEAAFKNNGYLFGFVVASAYFTYFEGGPSGAGFGKRAMRIRVVDFRSGGSIGYRRGFIRYIGRIVSALAFYIGYLWMLWDSERQCWHDKFADDLVVPVYG
jgi:uncharacterized RDD family membrane protein YckC